MKRTDGPLTKRLRCDGTLLCRPAYDPTQLCTRCEGAEALAVAEATIAAIDALHQPVIDSEWLVKRCEQCDMEWPCRTHLLIQPKERK